MFKTLEKTDHSTEHSINAVTCPCIVQTTANDICFTLPGGNGSFELSTTNIISYIPFCFIKNGVGNASYVSRVAKLIALLRLKKRLILYLA